MKVVDPRKRRQLTVALGIVFGLTILAIGPGVYLINPDPADPNSRFLFLGMPVIYVWAVFWYLVQAGVVLTAYLTLWGTHPGRGGE